MGCGCGKSNKNFQSKRNVVTPNSVSAPNMQPSSNRTVVPVNAQRASALGMTQSAEYAQYMNPQRLKIEKMRREAIQQALKKQFM